MGMIGTPNAEVIWLVGVQVIPNTDDDGAFIGVDVVDLPSPKPRSRSIGLLHVPDDKGAVTCTMSKCVTTEDAS